MRNVCGSQNWRHYLMPHQPGTIRSPCEEAHSGSELILKRFVTQTAQSPDALVYCGREDIERGYQISTAFYDGQCEHPPTGRGLRAANEA